MLDLSGLKTLVLRPMESPLQKLQQILETYESVLVAYSGGVDSAYLLKVAHDLLGDRVVALTALSPSFPSYEKGPAVDFARRLGVRHLCVETDELENPNYRANQGDRCYFCKTELYRVCRQKADALGLKTIVNGTHRDDLGEVRPGLRAAPEFGVRSPLLEAGFTKEEIRRSARELGLSLWEKPALACLASRFPVGIEVTPERLLRIDRIESGLAALGFKTFRVRYQDQYDGQEKTARIEVGADEVPRFTDTNLRHQVMQLCQENGFSQVALDLDGYQRGGAERGTARIQIL